MLIILSGLPGTGKTTIARAFARETGAVHLRIDSIECAVLDSAIAPSSVEDAGYRAACAVAADNLRLGHVVVADCVNPLDLTRDAWRAVAREAGAPSIDVEIICSDEREHRRRVETRLADIAGHRSPTWSEVVAREYDSWTVDRLVVDSARSTVDEAVDDILAAMARARAAELLVITGSMGAGKSTVMAEASDLLDAATVRHAAIDFDALAIGIADDAVAYRNLRSVAGNFAAAGISKLVIAAAIEHRGVLQRLCSAAGASSAVVCRVRASIPAMEARVRLREPGMLQQQFVERVAVLEGILDAAALEAFSVVNEDRPATEVAREVLLRVGWLPPI